MQVKGTTRLIGIFGDPVAHSISPAMHNAGFERYGLDYMYVPLPVKENRLPEAIESLRIFGFRGVNVTTPHKQAVIPFLDEISEEARLIGAVNTIVNEKGRLSGTTTDPNGFLEGFRKAGGDFTGRTVALLGSGGSARTLAFTLLLKAKVAKLILLARNPLKAQHIADEVKDKLGESLEVRSLDDFQGISPQCQIVVNTTTVGMHPHVEETIVSGKALLPGQTAYDIVYVPEQTLFLTEARKRGLKTVGGLDMLVHQGTESFKLWTGIEPDAEIFFAQAREQLRAARDAESNKDG